MLIAYPLFSLSSLAERIPARCAERTKEGIDAARLKGKTPGRPILDKDDLQAALTLTQSGISPTKAAKQLGIGRSTLYRELKYLKLPT